MTQHFKDQMFVAITNEIEADERRSVAGGGHPGRGRAHGRARVLGATAAVVAIVAGVAAVAAIDDPDTVDVATEAAGQPTPTTTDPAADAAFEGGYMLGSPVGTVYRVPGDWMGSLNASYVPVEGEVSFRLAAADERLQPMRIIPWTSIGMESRVVETIGDRVISTPANASYPSGMDESNATGPWFFDEADGTQWMATGLLVDLRLALPDIAYTSGHMVLGATLEAAAPFVAIAPELHRVRDDRFDVTVSQDTTTDFSFADPGRGKLELVDVNGHPGARWTGGSISWRQDADTVIEVSQAMSMTAGDGPSADEVLAAARSVRPATVAEMKSFKRWRGASVERVVLTVPADLEAEVKIDLDKVPAAERGNYPADGSASRPSAIEVKDLDGPAESSFTFAPGAFAGSGGIALPIGADLIGHRLELTLQPAAEVYGELPVGRRGCTIVVTVPVDGAEPVLAHLDDNC